MIDMRVMTVNHKSTEHEKKTTAKPLRKGKPLQFYADDDLIGAVHDWLKRQPGKAINQSEALRRLTVKGLKAEAEEAADLEAEAKKKGGRK
jgi:hypothetical protein